MLSAVFSRQMISVLFRIIDGDLERQRVNVGPKMNLKCYKAYRSKPIIRRVMDEINELHFVYMFMIVSSYLMTQSPNFLLKTNNDKLLY